MYRNQFCKVYHNTTSRSPSTAVAADRVVLVLCRHSPGQCAGRDGACVEEDTELKLCSLPWQHCERLCLSATGELQGTCGTCQHVKHCEWLCTYY